MPFALLALAVGAFGIGVTEFVIMGLLLNVSADFHVSTSQAGLLISGYALGVAVGAPTLTIATSKISRKRLLLALMVVFTIGNAACALAPTYGLLMAARVLTSFAHGSFFGAGSIVATRLVAKDKRALAIATMFTGLTIANIIGVPFGTWLGQHYGWRSTFWAVAVIGVFALSIICLAVPRDRGAGSLDDWRSDLRAIFRLPVLLGLATTVLGYGGLFTAFTYIAPLLTKVAGFSDASISPILLLFGGGLVVGNLLAGRLADRSLIWTLVGCLALLVLVLLGFGPALGNRWLTLIFVALLGAAGFSTVAPLQLWVIQKAGGEGENLASSFNIAAFNLGNAIGAWIGGLVVDDGVGLQGLPTTAALFPLWALALVGLSVALERRRRAVGRAAQYVPMGD